MSVTEVTKKGPIQQLIDSVVGVILGIILVPASFLPIIYGEFVMTNYGKVVDASAELNAEAPQADLKSKPVTVTGNGTIEGPAADSEYIKGGNYLTLSRDAQMYAWVEKSESKEEKKGGTKTTTTTYYYEMEWTSFPSDGKNFKEQGYTNPQMTIQAADFKAKKLTIGKVPVNLEKATIKNASALSISQDKVAKAGAEADGTYLYMRKGAGANPIVGDIRISYRAVEIPDGGAKATAYGQYDGSTITYDTANTFQAVMLGTRQELSSQLHAEFVTMQWIMRILMFIMLAVGLVMIAGPITTLLDFIPWLGELGASMIKIVMVLIAFVVTVITSILAHYFWIIIIVGLGVLIWAKFIRKKKEEPSAPAEPPAAEAPQA